MSRRRYLGRNERHVQRQMVWFATSIAAVCILMILAVTVCQVGRMKRNLQENTILETEEPVVLEIQDTPLPQKDTKKDTSKTTKKQQQKVYTYLQGPKSWQRQIDWSGEWGEAYMDGGYFGAFGCGLCCLANIYSTQTKYLCSPLDMYDYAKENTGYAGGMAIGWGYMKNTLMSLGFECKVNKKPDSYKKFAEAVSKAESCIVLISSNDSTVYWKNTPGHYVTISLYNQEDGTVFLADSGNPNHNRQTISLKKIYRSLKTASNWQYMSVGDYNKKKDSWRNKGTKGNWVVPEYKKEEVAS